MDAYEQAAKAAGLDDCRTQTQIATCAHCEIAWTGTGLPVICPVCGGAVPVWPLPTVQADPSLLRLAGDFRLPAHGQRPDPVAFEAAHAAAWELPEDGERDRAGAAAQKRFERREA